MNSVDGGRMRNSEKFQDRDPDDNILVYGYFWSRFTNMNLLALAVSQ